MISPLPGYISDSIIQKKRQKVENLMMIVVLPFPYADLPGVFE